MQPYDLAKLIVSTLRRDPSSPDLISHVKELRALVGEAETEILLREARNESVDRRRRVDRLAGR